jgi:O-antigen ligase
VLALLGYWLWCVIAVSFGTDPARAWKFVEMLSKIVLPFLVGISTIKSLRQVSQLAWVLVLSEGYVAWEMNLSYYSGYNRLWQEGFGDMDNNCNAIAFVSCFGMAVFLGLHTKNWWVKGVALGTAGLMANAILFSFSRGGMLALAVSLIVAFAVIPKQPKHYLGFALIVLAVVRLAGPQVVERFETTFVDASERDESADSRLRLWSCCWDSMLRRPLGIGPGHWSLVVAEYGFREGKLAHSLWLQLGAEVGFPGLALLLLFYGLCFVKLLPFTFERATVPDPWCRYFARMVITALGGFWVSAQFVSLQDLEHPYYIVLVGAAVLKLSGTSAAGEADAPGPAESRRETENEPARALPGGAAQ